MLGEILHRLRRRDRGVGKGVRVLEGIRGMRIAGRCQRFDRLARGFIVVVLVRGGDIVDGCGGGRGYRRDCRRLLRAGAKSEDRSHCD